MDSLALERACRQPLNHALVENQIQDQGRENGQTGCGKRWPPLDLPTLSGEVQQARLNGAQALAADKGQGEQQVVPEKEELVDSTERSCIRNPDVDLASMNRVPVPLYARPKLF